MPDTEFDSTFNKEFENALKRSYHIIPFPSDEQIQVSWKGMKEKLDLEQNLSCKHELRFP